MTAETLRAAAAPTAVWQAAMRTAGLSEGCIAFVTDAAGAGGGDAGGGDAGATVVERCGEHYAQHPSRPELVAVCTLPPGHEGDHDNVLPKHGAAANLLAAESHAGEGATRLTAEERERRCAAELGLCGSPEHYHRGEVERILVDRAAAVDRGDTLRAAVDRSGRPSNDRDGACICDYNPASTDGPHEDCPFHGRPYTYWVKRSDVLSERLAAVEALCEKWDARYGLYPNGFCHSLTIHEVTGALSNALAVEAAGRDEEGSR